MPNTWMSERMEFNIKEIIEIHREVMQTPYWTDVRKMGIIQHTNTGTHLRLLIEKVTICSESSV